MTTKPHPEKVSPTLVSVARRNAKGRGDAWTKYIIAHYRATGNLAPGCDARDFYAVWDEGARELDREGNGYTIGVAEG